MKQKLELGREYIPKDEAVYTEKIIKDLRKLLEKSYPEGTIMRAFHPKIIGLVKAEFIVESDLPQDLQVGIFRPGKVYKAWIRFSNAKRHPQADKKKDLRGMAIKLMGVEGEKLLENEQDAQTHDFLMITHPTLQTDTVKSFQKGIAALLGGIFTMLPYAIQPWNWGIIIRSIQSLKKFSNLLEAQFWSTTAYRFGTEDRAVKYAARPQVMNQTPFPEHPTHDFLRENMKTMLAQQAVYFDFLVQFQTNAERMPIEDPTKEWDSPFQKLATIKIVKQEFDSQKQLDYGQNLAFTPWHCIAAHKPIGGANRARKKAYEVLSAFRLERSGLKSKEPTDWQTFD
ncbi:MAG: catalase family protein [Flammeovirgaceae bacterium]